MLNKGDAAAGPQESGGGRQQAAAAVPPPGDQGGGHKLKLAEKLGSGAFATVFRGTYDGAKVAVKVLSPDARTAQPQAEVLFLQEARLLQQLHHSNVVRCHAIVKVPARQVMSPAQLRTLDRASSASAFAAAARAGGSAAADAAAGTPTWGMVLELMKGGSLQRQVFAQMASPGTTVYSEAQALEWALDVARALEHLHLAVPCIIHRDVKPSNVLLTQEGGRLVAKLSDFGLCVLTNPDRRRLLRMSTASAVSTQHQGQVFFEGEVHGPRADSAAHRPPSPSLQQPPPSPPRAAATATTTAATAAATTPPGDDGSGRGVRRERRAPARKGSFRAAHHPEGGGLVLLGQRTSSAEGSYHGGAAAGAAPDGGGGGGGAVPLALRLRLAEAPSAPVSRAASAAAGDSDGDLDSLGTYASVEWGQQGGGEQGGMAEAEEGEVETVFHLTSHTGSALYMSPEIHLRQPYNEKADVFSFGVLLFELLARTSLAVSELPQGARSSPQDALRYAAKVAGGYRPARPKKLAADMWELIGSCWHQDPVQRPHMSQVVQRLTELVLVKGASSSKPARPSFSAWRAPLHPTAQPAAPAPAASTSAAPAGAATLVGSSSGASAPADAPPAARLDDAGPGAAAAQPCCACVLC